MALPKRPYQSAARPSSTARVPSVCGQRSSDELAPTLVPPPAAPDTAVLLVPVVTQPAKEAAAAAAAMPGSRVFGVFSKLNMMLFLSLRFRESRRVLLSG